MLNLKNRIINKIKYYRIKIIRRKLKNDNPTIIANNCNATFMYKDLGLQFNSPTINLFFSIEDFVKFLEDMDNYLKVEIVEDTNTEKIIQ